VLCPNALQGLASSLAHTVGLQPAPHPDVAALRFPDFCQLHNAATAGTLERIMTKALCDPLAPLEMLEGLGQGLQVEERELEAECLQGSVDGWGDLAFDVASIETGVAHHLHSLWGNVGNYS